MSDPAASLASAELVGIILETLLFGFYLAVFSGSCYIIFSTGFSGRFSRGLMNKAMLVAFFILFASITTHWLIDVVRLFRAFIYREHNEPNAYYGFLSDGTNVAKTGLYALECVIADTIMILRLHYVWGRSYVVCIFPALTTLAFAVTGSGITYQFVIIKAGVNVFASECGRWILSSFALTLLTNLYSTSLISYKLWSALKPLRELKVASSIPHKRILQIVAESAAVYSACTLTTFITYLCRSNAQFPSLDLTSPMIGIVFCLIIVRVHILGHNNYSPSFGSSDFQMRSLSVAANTHICTYRDDDLKRANLPDEDVATCSK